MSRPKRSRMSDDKPRASRLFKLIAPDRRALALMLLTCVVAPACLIAVHIHRNPLLSPIDEAAHYDYVTRMSQGSVPRLGQPLERSTLTLISCRGTALRGLVAPPCGSKVAASKYPGGGYQYEAQQPPTYYAITVPMRWLTVCVLRVGSLDGTRATGALWLIAGLLLFWVTGRLIRIHPSALAAGVLLLASGPVVLYESSIVTNDAASVFAGGLVAAVSAAAWRLRGRWVPPTLFAVGLLAPALKASNVLAVIVLSAALAFANKRTQVEEEPAPAHNPRRRHARSSWYAGWASSGGVLLLGGLVSAVAWVVIDRKLALINPATLPTFSVLRTHPIGVATIAAEAVSLWAPLTGSFAAFHSSAQATTISLSSNLQTIASRVIEYLVIAGGVAGFFVRRRLAPHVLGLLSLAALYAGGVVLGIGVWRTYNADPGLSGRYGLSVAPLLVLALVGAIRGKWMSWFLWIVALANVGLTFFFMLSA